ncbi:hypothetical protein ACQ86D_21605 [Streptomyces galilaeus]
MSGIGHIKGLRELRSLTWLSINQVLPGDSLADSLPVDAPLEYLHLRADTVSGTGLRGLGQWPTLTTLRIGASGRSLTTADWQEVASLPALTELQLEDELSSASLSAMPELPEVRIQQM